MAPGLRSGRRADLEKFFSWAMGASFLSSVLSHALAERLISPRQRFANVAFVVGNNMVFLDDLSEWEMRRGTLYALYPPSRSCLPLLEMWCPKA
jgi:hypothetical protein